MKRFILYTACLFSFLMASCSEKDDVVTGGNGTKQTYVPFAINKGVNISAWLSQSDVRGEARKNNFTEAEVQQLAGFGFDHIRLPMDEEQLFTEDGQKIPEAFELMHNAIKWCKEANMKVIADLHILRSHHFNNNENSETIKSFFDTFEDGKKANWYSTHGASVTTEVVENPEKDAINSTDKVLYINKQNVGMDWPAGQKAGFELPVGLGKTQFKYLRMKFRKDKVSTMTVVLTDQNNKDYYTGYANKEANKWEDIAIEIQGKMDGICTKITLRPDNAEGKLYIDDVFLSDSPTGNNMEIKPEGTTSVPKLWTDKDAQYKYFDLWKALADELKEYPNDLVAYELLNEPVAPYASQWNSLSSQLVRELRLTEPERKLVIGSNMWQGVGTFDALTAPANDPNIILSFHFYNPHLFTHYQAEWAEMKDLNVAIHYPGEVITPEDYAQLSDKEKKIVDPYMGTYDKGVLAGMAQKAIKRAQELGLQLHCGEFGCYKKTPKADRINWMQDIISIFRENGIAYSYWDYKAGFGFCNSKGEVIDQEVLNLLTK